MRLKGKLKYSKSWHIKKVIPKKEVISNHLWELELFLLISSLPALWNVAILTSNKIVFSVGIGSSNSYIAPSGSGFTAL